MLLGVYFFYIRLQKIICNWVYNLWNTIVKSTLNGTHARRPTLLWTTLPAFAGMAFEAYTATIFGSCNFPERTHLSLQATLSQRLLGSRLI